MRKLLIGLACLLFPIIACVRTQPEIIVITATFQAASQEAVAAPPAGQTPAAPPLPDAVAINPTPDPTRALPPSVGGGEYVVQPGDSLTGIAARFGVSVETLLSVNNLPNPDILEVGQVIVIPGPPNDTTPDLKLLPDSKLVYGPGSAAFDVAGFVAAQPGFIRTATDEVNGAILPAAAVVERVAHEYSVDPRMLLALLELKAGWLTNPAPSDALKAYPLSVPDSPFGFTRAGLYRQLAYAADQLNLAYYGWKQRGLTALEFADGTRLLYAPGLNAGTVALQFFLSQNRNYGDWQRDVSREGFYRAYFAFFGDPFSGAVDPVVPPNIEQPPMAFPFPSGEIWFFTGGPHGGWGGGSAWAAVDFAPPDDPATKSTACYVSDYFATAVAAGLIARTDEGTVILDLDGDGDESTGWTVLYLHMAAQDRVQAGARVEVGDRIGRPSCEGGFSNGTHMHIARRYNGEWIPAHCDSCPSGNERPPFVMNGWTMIGLPGQEYQGYMVKGDEQRIAEQGRETTENRVSW